MVEILQSGNPDSRGLLSVVPVSVVPVWVERSPGTAGNSNYLPVSLSATLLTASLTLPLA